MFVDYRGSVLRLIGWQWKYIVFFASAASLIVTLDELSPAIEAWLRDATGWDVPAHDVLAGPAALRARDDDRDQPARAPRRARASADAAPERARHPDVITPRRA